MLQIGRCSKCGRNNKLLPSNNPLIEDICVYCIKSKIDYQNLDQVDFFCRTYNIPFNPEKWMVLAENHKENVFEEYIEWVKSQYKDTLYWTDGTNDLWKRINEEWAMNRTHEELIAKLAPIKDGFILRNRIKWGSQYTFEELIALENLFVETLRSNDLSNPIQIDSVKKACKMSVALDRSILSGDSKEIKALSGAYRDFIKTANLDELIAEEAKDVISNVAELVDFIERSGFVMPYYDGVERDVVDKSINDIKQYIRTLVGDAVGLDIIFETINNSLKAQQALEKDKESFERVSLEELYENALKNQSEKFDSEFENEEVDVSDLGEEDFDDDDFNYFG